MRRNAEPVAYAEWLSSGSKNVEACVRTPINRSADQRQAARPGYSSDATSSNFLARNLTQTKASAALHLSSGQAFPRHSRLFL